MNRMLWSIGLCAVLSASASSCGNGDEPPVKISVDGSRTLGSLEAADLAQICKDLEQAVGYVTREESCTLVGVMAKASAAVGEAECRAIVASCLAAPDPDPTQGSCGLRVDDLSGCTATVADYERCVNDSLIASKRQVAGLTCSSELKLPQSSAFPASCSALREACPGFFFIGGMDGAP